MKTGLFSSLQQWLLTADMKEMTVNSIGNARSVLIQSVFLLIFKANTEASTRQSTQCVWYLMTDPISDVL